MKIEAKQTVVVTIQLDEDEAIWLKAVMQNPLSENEYKDDRIFRERLWNALHEAGCPSV